MKHHAMTSRYDIAKHRVLTDMNDKHSYVAKESVINAKIIWVLKIVMSGF